MKIIAIHQPNYLPWLGYFYKIWASDTFILHDNVQYTKQSLTKRVFIRPTPHTIQPAYLSLPLKKHSDFSLIKDLEICHTQNWQAKHLNKIQNAYRKAPYFEQYFPKFERTILQAHHIKNLKTLNAQLIIDVLACLKVQKSLIFSSDLPIYGYRATEYNATIVKYLNGHQYLSGTGALKYQTEWTYNQLGIDLVYNDVGHFLKNTPPQYPVPFVAGLSILDALFYIGETGILKVFNDYKNLKDSNK